MKAVRAAAALQKQLSRNSRFVAAAATAPSSIFATQQRPRPFSEAAAASSAGGTILKELTKENPYIDVVRYEHKNRKWSLNHVDYYSEALAIGFLELGLQPGDKVLSWLPLHFSESMVLQFACSKAGFILYHLDPAQAVANVDTSQKALEEALHLSEANILVSQEAGSDVNYIRIAEDLMPELAVFDYEEGYPFVSPQFPNLRLAIHTGFDQDNKWGWLPMKHMLVPSDNLKEHLGGFTVTGSTPLHGTFEMDANGIPTKLGKTLSNEEVSKANVWPTYSAILKKEYHLVEGTGVVW